MVGDASEKEASKVMKIRTVAAFGVCLIVALAGLLFVLMAWDYVTMTLQSHDTRIRALEMSARPLIVVDRYSSVYLNGEPVPLPQVEVSEERK